MAMVSFMRMVIGFLFMFYIRFLYYCAYENYGKAVMSSKVFEKLFDG
jgi:hypothetical protein